MEHAITTLEGNPARVKPFVTVSDTPLFHSLYRLYSGWYVRCQAMPKYDRFAIGQKTNLLILDMLTDCTRAYHTKDVFKKHELLQQVSSTLESLKILIRLAKDVKAIDQKCYIYYETELQSTGRMLGGWIVSLTKKNGK